MITIDIDVTKIDKGRLKDGKYLKLTLIDTPNGKYGDFMVKQSVTKEEREARVDMPILGNGKDWSKGKGGKSQAAPAAKAAPQEPADDDIPW